MSLPNTTSVSSEPDCCILCTLSSSNSISSSFSNSASKFTEIFESVIFIKSLSSPLSIFWSTSLVPLLSSTSSDSLEFPSVVINFSTGSPRNFAIWLKKLFTKTRPSKRSRICFLNFIRSSILKCFLL